MSSEASEGSWTPGPSVAAETASGGGGWNGMREGRPSFWEVEEDDQVRTEEMDRKGHLHS